jgi:hypothetical protein
MVLEVLASDAAAGAPDVKRVSPGAWRRWPGTGVHEVMPSDVYCGGPLPSVTVAV